MRSLVKRVQRLLVAASNGPEELEPLILDCANLRLVGKDNIPERFLMRRRRLGSIVKLRCSARRRTQCLFNMGRRDRVELLGSSQKNVGIFLGTKHSNDISVAERRNVIDDRIAQNVVFTTVELAAANESLVISQRNFHRDGHRGTTFTSIRHLNLDCFKGIKFFEKRRQRDPTGECVSNPDPT
jgi:hypothetical protein